MKYTIYQETTGRILGTGATSYGEIPPQVDGVAGLTGHFDSAVQYVVDETVIDRPTMNISLSDIEIIASGTDICTITGVLAGAEVTSNGTTITADGNDIGFVTDIPGEHRLSIRLWPYQDAEVIINAI